MFQVTENQNIKKGTPYISHILENEQTKDFDILAIQ